MWFQSLQSLLLKDSLHNLAQGYKKWIMILKCLEVGLFQRKNKFKFHFWMIKWLTWTNVGFWCSFMEFGISLKRFCNRVSNIQLNIRFSVIKSDTTLVLKISKQMMKILKSLSKSQWIRSEFYTSSHRVELTSNSFWKHSSPYS